jgi:nicotinamidase-related amidase
MKPVVTIFNMQNEIIHADGHIGARGNAKVVQERGILRKTASLLAAARGHGIPVFYVGSGYNEAYDGLNRSVALFADAEPGHRLQVGSWGAQFPAEIAPRDGDTVLYRPGIGAFTSTNIGSLLPAPEDSRVYVAGVSTRLVVEAAVFEFTDRGYPVSVVEDCCAAASPQAHADAIKTLALFAAIEPADQVIARLSGAPGAGLVPG